MSKLTDKDKKHLKCFEFSNTVIDNIIEDKVKLIDPEWHREFIAFIYSNRKKAN